MAAIKVLIVDDIDWVRQDLSTLLTLAVALDSSSPVFGHQKPANGKTGVLRPSIEIIGEASNGLDAIRQVEALQPDVVIMDLEMPVMNGYESAARIKQQNPTCQVIALSVHDYEAARLKATQAGVDLFIVKGTPVEILIQAILKES
jgi:DNA-binding NarL/FixJ family response regulator